MGNTKLEAWDPEWENIYKSEAWGKYPSEHLIRFIARHFYGHKDRSTCRILEIGCGSGAQIWFMAREGFDVYGVDASRTALEGARTRFAEAGLEADLVIGDVIELNYPDNYFDGVVDIECLMGNDWDSTKRIIANVRRVLKAGGHFFSQTFTTETYVGQNREELEKNTYRNVGDGPLARKRLLRLTSEEDIASLYAGFSRVLYDMASLSRDGRKYFTEEWLITCTL